MQQTSFKAALEEVKQSEGAKEQKRRGRGRCNVTLELYRVGADHPAYP